MRFFDSVYYDIEIPKLIKYANSDSSLFNFNESLSDDTSPEDQNSLPADLFQNSSNTNSPSNTISPFKQILKATDTNHFSERTRHPSRNQFAPPLITDSRDTKTHYNLRPQPKKEYCLFIPPHKL